MEQTKSNVKEILNKRILFVVKGRKINAMKITSLRPTGEFYRGRGIVYLATMEYERPDLENTDEILKFEEYMLLDLLSHATTESEVMRRHGMKYVLDAKGKIELDDYLHHRK